MSEENKEENLEEAVDEIKQRFGEGSIMKLEEIRAVDVDAIPTGSLDLDLALGVRGIPRGRLAEIFGPEASGKTTLALHVTAEAQNKGGTAAYVDAEHALDPGYARKIGVNVRDILISQPDSGEQALEIVESLVRSEAIDVIVVDSVAALTPQKEIAGEMGDDQVALQARLMSKACLTGDTELIDPVTGEVSTIEEIVDGELSWHTTTYDEENDGFVVSEVTDWIPQGKREVFKIETKDGHTLKLTDDHEVFTMDGWKEVKDLTQQDHLAIHRKAPVSESNSSEQLNDEGQEIDWDKISSISKVGEREVYDLSVKDHPNFVANGVLVHNCRKLSGIISDTKTSVIFLNQTRMKIGVRFGNPTTTPGGKALKFYSSVRIKLNRKAKIKEGDEITGSRIKAKVIKNKVAAPFRSAVFDVFYNEGISRAGDLIRTGTEYDVVERAGSWYKYGDEKLGQGRSNARDFLNENPEVAEEIEDKIIETYKEQSEFEESPEEEDEDEDEEEGEGDKEEKED